MKTNMALFIGICLSAFVGALATQVTSTNVTGYIDINCKPGIVKVKSGGEVIAEIRLRKAFRLGVSGLHITQVQGPVRTGKGGSIEISPDGLTPWRISGEGLEVEYPESISGAK